MRRWRLCVGLAAVFCSGCRLGGDRPDGSGTIECTQVQVAPSVAGRIVELSPDEGGVVHSGQIVARLDPADYALRRDEARAALAQAEAQLDLLRAGSREEDIQRAREQVREARAAQEAADADLERVRRVFERQSATRKQMDDARIGSERASAVRAAVEQSLARLLKGSRPEEIRAAESAVDVAKARVALAEKAIADCAVPAPLDGVVTTRSREVGEWVGAGSVLMTVSRLDEVWLSVYVPEPRLAGVTIGQPARVRLDGMERTLTGTVTYVSSEAEFTPRNVQTADERAKLVYRVKITLPNPDGALKPGMPADGYLAPAGR